MAKFNIGDKVWYAAREAKKIHIKCPDCLGTGVLTVRFADGKEVTIGCATCGPGYERPTGYVTYYQYQSNVREVTIEGINIKADKTEYYFDDNRYATETEFFDTKKEAEIKAKEIADADTLEEMNRLYSKEKPTRTWAFNACYYRDRIKSAEQDIAIYKAKLASVPIKYKESKGE